MLHSTESPDPSLLRVERFDLVEAVVQRLRESICRGEFGEYLMAERSLSQALGVSRPTLRAALGVLEAEGLLERSGSRGERRVFQPSAQDALASKRVRLLQNGSPACNQGEQIRMLQVVSDLLQEMGATFSVITRQACFSGRPERALARLVADCPADLWIVHLSTRAMQRWFANQGHPCLVLGSSWEETGLSSLDVDYSALCRHAAGMLLGRGHRQLAVLYPESPRRGDSNGLEAFREAVDSSPTQGAHCRMYAHQPGIDGICRAVDSILRQQPMPDGWLVFGADTYFTVFSHLFRKGVSVGDRISLICRNYDPMFDALTPGVAHYRRDSQQSRRYLSRLLKTLLGVPGARRETLRIGPAFVDGGSLRTSVGR